MRDRPSVSSAGTASGSPMKDSPMRDSTMTTGKYQRGGIQFRYPENWKLADDSMEGIPRTVSIQAPSGAFWSIDIHPFSVDPDELMTQALEAMRGEYPDLEASETDTIVAGNESRGYDLYFCCLDFVVASRMRAFRLGHATYMLTYQAEDREFEQMEPVFDAITHSYFQENDTLAHRSD
jgi:hypothetical protein